MTTVTITIRKLACMFFALAFMASCGDGVGERCGSNDDCDDGYCCKEGKCGGGMCTFRCDSDRDCPGEMGCRSGNCLFLCPSADDRECAPGFRCKEKDGQWFCEGD